MTPDQAAEALAALETKRAAGETITAEDVAAAIEAQDVQRHAAADARRAALTPHVRKPGKPMPKVSGPRYFNLMRAMERYPDEYAAYRETTYCGAPITEVDWDKRSALAKKNTKLVAEQGVCPDCLTIAQGGS